MTSGKRPTSGPEPTVLDVRLLVPALVAWAVMAWQVDASPGRMAWLAAGCFAMSAMLLARRRAPVWAMCGAACALVLSAGAARAAVDHTGPVPRLAAEQAAVRLSGTVLTEPRVITRGDERRDLVVLTMLVGEVTGRGERARVHTPVVVFADRSWQQVRWRQQVEVRGRLGPPDPGDDVVATFSPLGPPEQGRAPPLALQAADHARERLRASVAPLPEDARALVPGLVIGDTSLTPPDLTEAMLATGMTHLSAVSGANVAIVLGAVVLVCQRVGVPRRWRPWLALACLAGFVILCRPEPSVLRAGAMGVVGLLALSTARRRVSLPALAAAVLTLLCVDPWLARSAGFALSVLATLGLVVFAGPWGEAIARRLPRRCQVLGYAVAIPLAAQVACGPVIVLLQGSISTVGVLANLLAAPLVAPTTIAGILSALVGLAWAPLGVYAAWLAAVPAWLIGQVARRCAELPLGTLDWADGAVGAWLLAAVTVLVLALGPWLLHHALDRPLTSLAVLLLGVVLAWPAPHPRGWPPAGWVVVGCDVGQGDAFVVANGPGRAVVVDVGPDPALVGACLERLGVTQVDALVLSHFHADHVRGLSGVLDRLPVGAAYLTPVREPEPEAHEVTELLAEAGVPAYQVRAGDTLDWGSVHARVLWPGRAISSGSVANNGSIVLDLTVAPPDGGRGPAVTEASTRVLFTGDIEPEAAAEVRRAIAGQDVDVDVLKVAHHGSAAQDAALVRGLRPEVALIGVGGDNTFGHPTPSALRLLGEVGAVVLRTDTGGDIAVTIGDSGDLAVANRGPG